MNSSTASLSLRIATFQAQALTSLLGASNGEDDSFMSIFAGLQNTDGTNALSGTSDTKSVASTGRNMALFDPEAAYDMMTDINRRDVLYKAQYAELSQMGGKLTSMEDVGTSLGSMTLSTGNEVIQSDLKDFVDQYNGWVQRFAPDMQSGGLLADTQAAQVAQWELQESVKNTFNGARDGVHGLRDLGISIDPGTRLASLDTGKLAAMLASNKQGVVDAVQEFSANFAKSADMLNAEGNFMPRQLDNLSRVIHYIADNITSLQAEFGTGDSAKPTGRIAQALAAYNKSYAT